MVKKKKRVNEQKRARTEAKIKKAILHFLRLKQDRAFNHKQIAAGANVRGRISHEGMLAMLDAMVEKGQIKNVGRGKYTLNYVPKVLTGTLDVNRDGFGFVTIDGQEDKDDIFIAPRGMGKALNGDAVKIRLTRRRGNGQRAEGEILEVISRAHEQYIGRIEKVHGGAVFIHDDPKVTQNFLIQESDLANAADGDKVLAEILEWEDQPLGRVTRVLGAAGENETEMHAILFQFGFDPKFPEEVEAETAKFKGRMTKAEIKKRRDMRSVTTFTVDPPDAKDFDDALSFRRLDNGHLEVGVHIADVSHYVQRGTALDKEAFNRATSVYLVDRTVPMLPERLSNELCSLRPNEDKFTFSAVFEVDEQGKLHDEWFGRTVIHSDRRFAYEEAQAIMDAGEGDYVEELTMLNKLAKIFQAARYKRGSINFEDDEVKFELDADGKPLRVYRKVRKDAHKMIEDWMLLANRRVCEFVYRKRKGIPLPFVYRIHDRPDEEKLQTLQQFASTLGYELNLADPGKVAKSLNALMTSVDGKPEQSMIQTVAVRTMAKAIYSTDNIGHYGLGFEYYSHFTSPIRRYPDLMVHRLLGQYLEGNYAGDVGTLESACKHCTNRERRAVEAERASVKHKQVEFLEDKVGAQFEGVVSGVTNWGLYVELVENRCEGMVGLHSLNDDYYEVDKENYCIRGRASGTVISLGDKVKIEIKGTSLRNRTIDFTLVEILESNVSPVFPPAPARPEKQVRRRKGSNKTGPRKTNSRRSKYKKKRK